MTETNAFNASPGAAPAKATPVKAAKAPVWGKPAMQHPELRGRIDVPARQAGKTAALKTNPRTAVSGVPRPTAAHPERQLDGNRTQQFTQPVKRGGLAERMSSPAPSPRSADRQSGLEAAMGSLADSLHKRSRPKSTQRRS